MSGLAVAEPFEELVDLPDALGVGDVLSLFGERGVDLSFGGHPVADVGECVVQQGGDRLDPVVGVRVDHRVCEDTAGLLEVLG